MIYPLHFPVIDAIGSGCHSTREIAQAADITLPEVWARLSELRKANVVRAEQTQRPGVHGRPPKLYRLNVWSEQP